MENNYKVLIIGYGVVGHNVYNELKALNPEVVDKYAGVDTRKRVYMPFTDERNPEIRVMKLQVPKYDLAFICVDTPMSTDDNHLDTEEVANAIIDNDAEVYVIKSTCPICTTAYFGLLYKKRIVYSPEYYGGTQHCNNFDFNFTILGGEKADCIYVQQILQRCYDARHTFHITDSNTAELVKFMENSWLATKVSFCNQFYNIAKEYHVDYEDLRELFILDPRVNPSHTFVYRDQPYWDSHCLNKDVRAIAESSGAELLKAVIDFNELQKIINPSESL